MKRSKGLRLGVAVKAAVGVAGVAITLLTASHAMGGPVRTVVLEGSSMEPALHGGDLLIVRRTGDYREGDVVAYRSRHLNGAVVAHRVVGTEGDRLTLQGDNNDWLDPETPTVSEVLGERWILIPRGGTAIRWLGTPAGWIAAGGLTIAVGAGGGLLRRRKRARRSGEERPPQRNTRSAGSSGGRDFLVAALLVGALASGALGGLSLLRGEAQASLTEHPYRHTGRFGYQASTAPGPAYQDGEVETGDVLFRRLVERVEVSFDYRLETSLPVDVQGTARLAARISDGAGWRFAMELGEETSFAGPEARLEGAMDVGRIGEVIRGLERSTGATDPVYTVELLPEIEVDGIIADQAVEESFSPSLAFSMDPVRLWLPTPEGAPQGENPLEPVEAGSVEVGRFEPGRLSFGPVELPVGDARRAAAVGGGLSLLGLLVVGVATRLQARQGGELGRILSRYGRLIVSIGDAGLSPAREVIETDSMESLVSLATRHDRVILHQHGPDEDIFLLNDDGVTYRYRPPGRGSGERLPTTLMRTEGA